MFLSCLKILVEEQELLLLTDNDENSMALPSNLHQDFQKDKTFCIHMIFYSI